MEPASTYPKMETSTICVGDSFHKAHNSNLSSLHSSLFNLYSFYLILGSEFICV